MTIYIILAIVGVIILWGVVVYNGFVSLKNRCQEAWSDIDVQLKRRYDLIPNLVKTVRAYVKHEKGVFIEVTRARTEAISASGAPNQAMAENMLSSALKSLFAVAENYPQLRASENFRALQDELSDTENKISAARRFYNGQVRDFNTKLQVFPNSMIAGWVKFSQFELFQVSSGEKEKAAQAPEVEL
ncbi:MAG: LemA protein [Candidatus Berkelbacteria bacterium Licking1014_7]|uniref:LemA protein n=1 Tax=Candidatus Berkelbacteria bacterium Licking1014_7 TaxID=2017147 RepID=A0A554LIB1_9BACT|nr:MAG: LemA protein [Candidatus Berkelbacteria bacterium Licking1014_7]